jgi:hypothetical protein
MFLIYVKNVWHAIHRHLFSRWALYLAFGIVLGVATNRVWDWSFLGKSVIINDEPRPVVIDYGDYFGILIDRTRNRLCQLQSTRILFKEDSVNGERLPFVLPLPETGLYWPIIGRSRYIVLIKKPTDLPPGIWMTQTITAENCSFWTRFFGPTFRESDPVTLPGIK